MNKNEIINFFNKNSTFMFSLNKNHYCFKVDNHSCFKVDNHDEFEVDFDESSVHFIYFYTNDEDYSEESYNLNEINEDICLQIINNQK